MYLQAWCSVLDGDKIYFVPSEFNALFCLDLAERRVEYKGSFQGKKYAECLYIKALLYGQEICFLPYDRNRLALYHTQTGEMRYLSVERLRGKVHDAFIEGDILYILAYQYPDSILKYDLKTGRCDRMSERSWSAISRRCGGVPEIVSKEQDYCFLAKRAGNRWWIIIRGTGILLKYDYQKDSFEVRTIKELQGLIVDDLIVGEKLWFKLRDRDVLVEYDYTSGKCESFEFSGEDEQIYATFMVECGSRILIVKGLWLAAFDKKSKSFELFWYQGENACFCFEKYRDKVILLPWTGKNIIVYDAERNVISEYPFEWKEELNEEKLLHYFDNKLYEYRCSLDDWLNAVGVQKHCRGSMEMAGRDIWNAVKNWK